MVRLSTNRGNTSAPLASLESLMSLESCDEKMINWNTWSDETPWTAPTWQKMSHRSRNYQVYRVSHSDWWTSDHDWYKLIWILGSGGHLVEKFFPLSRNSSNERWIEVVWRLCYNSSEEWWRTWRVSSWGWGKDWGSSVLIWQDLGQGVQENEGGRRRERTRLQTSE